MKKKVIGILLIAFIVTFIYLYNHNDETKLISKTIKYNGSNLMISIDGIVSNTLPISGSYYLASYDCKSSNTKITWDSLNYKLSVSNGNKKGGIACYLNFETTPKLTDMELGSYVSYVGNNGCPEGHCDGTNANYVSDTDMGYCPDSSGNFVVNGWRVAYIKENSAYLISAGAPECMCTSESGSISDDYCDSAVSYETVHIDNLDDRALKYCNKNYVDGGVCNYDTAWSFETDDFKNITGYYINSCANTYSNMSCGYNNDLIDIGSSYWFADTYSPGRGEVYFYDSNRIIDYYNSIFVYGMRPVIKLDSNVLVTGGSGTYDDPYIISKGN